MRQKKTMPSSITQKEYEHFSKISDRILLTSIISTIFISYLFSFIMNEDNNISNIVYNTLSYFHFISNDRFDKFYDFSPYYYNMNLASYVSVILNTIFFSSVYLIVYYVNIISSGLYEKIYFENLAGPIYILIVAALYDFGCFIFNFDINPQYMGTSIIFFSPVAPILISISTSANFFAIVLNLVLILKIFF